MVPNPSKKPVGIITDIDKTLTEKTTWLELTEKLGGDPTDHAEIFTDYLNNKIDLNTAKKRLFKVWRTQGKVHRSQIKEICQEVHLRGEAFATFNELKEKGYKLCIISGSFDVFVETVAERFGVECWRANAELIFDQDGYWVDLTYSKNEAELKAQQLQELLTKTNLKPEQCVALGDSHNDSEIFKIVPGIAVHTDSDHLKKLAWKEIHYLPRVIQLLESIGK